MPATAAVSAKILRVRRRSREIPRVTVYTRHRPQCRYVAKPAVNSCDCPKWLRWFRDGKMMRQSADTCDHAVATRKANRKHDAFEAAAEGKATSDQEVVPMLDEALAKFMEAKKGRGELSSKYIARLKRELGKFERWCHARGLMLLGDIKTEHVQDYRNALKGTQNTRAKCVYRMVGFFQYCVEFGWLKRNPARNREVMLNYSQTQKPRALNEAQFVQLLAAIPRVKGQTTDEQRHKLKALVLLMRHTGLAVRDAISIERTTLKRNGHGFWKLYLHREKTGHPVECLLHPSVMTEILANANPEGSRYVFVDSWPEKEDDVRYSREQRDQRERERDLVAAHWGRLMRKLGKVAGLQDEHGQPYPFTSHALRHTFVLAMLNGGLPTEDIGVLIGDSAAVVAAHYSEWIAARQDRLEQRMMSALGGIAQ